MEIHFTSKISVTRFSNAAFRSVEHSSTITIQTRLDISFCEHWVRQIFPTSGKTIRPWTRRNSSAPRQKIVSRWFASRLWVGSMRSLTSYFPPRRHCACHQQMREPNMTSCSGCERLLSRNVIKYNHSRQKVVIVLPLFSEWLAENAVAQLLPIWKLYKEMSRAAIAAEAGPLLATSNPESVGFVIPEDDIIAVSQRLIYCGRQKDVAEIRSWLRQFDDEPRIEIAFQLLKRLAEKGFVNEGARSLALSKLEEMVRARRLEIGGKAWKAQRGRLDNLCLAYVDSPLKSGAATTRDLKNMMRPGKSGTASEIGIWMERHLDDDPMVVVVDDFACTGESLAKGMGHFRTATEQTIWKRYHRRRKDFAVRNVCVP